MDTKKLRQKILDLAIHGKLVPQDPNDEPASVLLERIRAEKERLIAEGKIKRSKKSATSDTSHYENEVPFEVPKGWEWVSLSEIAHSCLGKMLDKAKNQGTLQPYLRNVNVRWGTFELEDLLQMPFVEEEDERFSVVQGDLVVCEGGEPGRCAIWENKESIKFQKALHRIRCFNGALNYYIKIVIEWYASSKNIELYYTGSTIKHLTGEALNTLQIPLPPIQEQHHIVSIVEQWMSLIDLFDTESSELKQSIEKAKSKILDLAIHGKLVPQDPNDEPASELLKRINPKFTPCDNAHYENIPEGWTVCALEEIIDYEQPQAYIVQSTEYKSQYKTPVLTAGKSFIIGYTNESEGVFTDVPVIIFDDFTTDSKFVDFPFKVKSSAMKILHVNEDVNIQYVCWFMSITRLIGDTHKRYWISEYSKLHIPIPPRKEQDRIINKVSALFQILDNISAEL